ncbi:Protein of unknown function [Gryllus bimaculatus]|nr:Protein of unknown function [Gryllus bimaculatus]
MTVRGIRKLAIESQEPDHDDERVGGTDLVSTAIVAAAEHDIRTDKRLPDLTLDMIHGSTPSDPVNGQAGGDIHRSEAQKPSKPSWSSLWVRLVENVQYRQSNIQLRGFQVLRCRDVHSALASFDPRDTPSVRKARTPGHSCPRPMNL